MGDVLSLQGLCQGGVPRTGNGVKQLVSINVSPLLVAVVEAAEEVHHEWRLLLLLTVGCSECVSRGVCYQGVGLVNTS